MYNVVLVLLHLLYYTTRVLGSYVQAPKYYARVEIIWCTQVVVLRTIQCCGCGSDSSMLVSYVVLWSKGH